MGPAVTTRAGVWLALLLVLSGCSDGICTGPLCGDQTPPPSVTGTISGRVLIEGAGAEGVLVALSTGASATTSSTGVFSFSNVPSGSHTVTISGFSSDATCPTTTLPATISATSAEVTVDFNCTFLRTASIFGTVSVGSAGLSDVTVSLSGVSSATTFSDSQGTFSFTGLRFGEYTVTISSLPSGIGFSVTSTTVTLATGQAETIGFVGVELMITGTIFGRVWVEGDAREGVVAQLTGVTTSRTATTGADGIYVFNDVAGGTYTVSISNTGADATFEPTSQSVTLATQGQEVTADFNGTYVRTASIVGTVTTSDGAGVAATVTLTGLDMKTSATDTSGRFDFTELRAGDYTVTVTAFPADVTLPVTARTVTVGTGESSSVSFVGTLKSDALTITTTSLPNGVVGVAYAQSLAASGGDGSYTWTISDGVLPSGLNLDGSTGAIAGNPTAAGDHAFGVVVASGDGQTAQRALSITVDATPVLEPSESCSDFSPAAIATFEDANLDRVIRAALSVGAQTPLTCGLISGLTGLSADTEGIASLVGIQNVTSMTGLYLSDNAIRDVGPLGSLTRLTLLEARNNAISDISGLSALTGLTALDLDGNSISDISVVAVLTSLTDLSLDRNSISDISALTDLTSLKDLGLGGNSISNVSDLSGLTSLRDLTLDGNSLSDIGALSNLTSLRTLQLQENSISDISALSALTSLSFLSLEVNSIRELGALSGLTSLRDLRMSSNSIGDITALSELANLTTLYLDNNSISDISVVSGLANLRVLRLDGNPINDISALGGLANLQTLALDSLPLSNIQPLLTNPGIGAGDSVSLTGTSVSCADIAALKAKGVAVTSDC